MVLNRASYVSIGIAAAVLLVCCLALAGARRMGRRVGTPPLSGTVAERLRVLGTGVYAWHSDRCGQPDEVAETLKRSGIGSIYLKGNDGSQPFGDRASILDLARACQAHGIRALIWGYTRAYHPAQEAETVIALLHTDGIDGYVFDAEESLEKPDRWEGTARLLQTVRAHRDGCPDCQNKLLGCAVFPYPSRHPGLPYKALVGACDFVSPMVYAGAMGTSPQRAVARMCREWLAWERQSGLSVPLVPLGQAFPGRGGLDAGSVAAFANATRGYCSTAFWDLESVQRAGAWDALCRAEEARASYRAGGQRAIQAPEPARVPAMRGDAPRPAMDTRDCTPDDAPAPSPTGSRRRRHRSVVTDDQGMPLSDAG